MITLEREQKPSYEDVKLTPRSLEEKYRVAIPKTASSILAGETL
jgi:hypothetical protein